jgi:CPA2 family monovalent cation:H+ antiporter-2
MATGEGEAHYDKVVLENVPEAIVVGIGPVGAQVASRLELTGIDVCLIDLSATNLHGFAQQGFRTVSGDASDTSVLMRAEADRAKLMVVCVPDDAAALRIVRSIREINSTARVLVRCRYVANTAALRRSGAHAVVSEEAEASEAIWKLLSGPGEHSVQRGEPVGSASH